MSSEISDTLYHCQNCHEIAEIQQTADSADPGQTMCNQIAQARSRGYKKNSCLTQLNMKF